MIFAAGTAQATPLKKRRNFSSFLPAESNEQMADFDSGGVQGTPLKKGGACY
ncbi:hypothetical protein [Endozoicomonas sp. SCSIO W0465]|uniref:hypothetical protein n=1 Tax=Endozoicomonas sp. SCSIO W0465 TaxID=2918516 RepID=UPI0020765FBA|nr:hypothetical protein [Endozoicomonas sp. SCSIO W0465]USE35539.1 hypothetical protein MJO57_26180 [Endozoicomonas sp. SCSIO W0465]